MRDREELPLNSIAPSDSIAGEAQNSAHEGRGRATNMLSTRVIGSLRVLAPQGGCGTVAPGSPGRISDWSIGPAYIAAVEITAHERTIVAVALFAALASLVTYVLVRLGSKTALRIKSLRTSGAAAIWLATTSFLYYGYDTVSSRVARQSPAPPLRLLSGTLVGLPTDSTFNVFVAPNCEASGANGRFLLQLTSNCATSPREIQIDVPGFRRQVEQLSLAAIDSGVVTIDWKGKEVGLMTISGYIIGCDDQPVGGVDLSIDACPGAVISGPDDKTGSFDLRVPATCLSSDDSLRVVVVDSDRHVQRHHLRMGNRSPIRFCAVAPERKPGADEVGSKQPALPKGVHLARAGVTSPPTRIDDLLAGLRGVGDETMRIAAKCKQTSRTECPTLCEVLVRCNAGPETAILSGCERDVVDTLETEADRVRERILEKDLPCTR